MNTSIETNLKTLRLSKKAFQLCKPKPKTETLLLALEQIEPILKEYMVENDVLRLELDVGDRSVVALEPIPNGQRDFWVKQWLKNKLPTEKLIEIMDERFEWVEYCDVAVFLDGVEWWLKEKANMND